MKLLITGASGQLGRCLVDRAIEIDGVDFEAFGSAELDICDYEAAKEEIGKYSPDFVINCAAYTAVDKAEDEPGLAQRVNATGAENLARVCESSGIPLIHISTDYVFDGSSSVPYVETDQVKPLGVYGETKLAGEQAVAANCPRHIILRTAWVYSEYGHNFLKTMLRLAETRGELSVVEDQIGCPTYAGDIANTILEVCKTPQPSWGIYHYVGATSCSWAEFAEHIFVAAGEKGLIDKNIVVNRIPASEYPTPAARPAFSVLDTGKIQSEFNIKPRLLDVCLAETLDNYAAIAD